LQRKASELVPEQRVSKCLWAAASRPGGFVDVLRRDGRARFGNLQTCGSVWACPICSSRISEIRRQELNHALAWARSQVVPVVPVMLTLTMRHTRADRLDDVLAVIKEAKRRFRQSKAWRRFKSSLVGSITATELTHGRNGWHPHFHELLFVSAASENDAVELVEELRSEWRRSLEKFGFTAGRAGFDVRGAAAAGNYVSKFGAAEELALSGAKKGREGQRTPAQLLAAAADGDDHAAALWAVYARAFRGKRQLVWSDGFKQLINLEEMSDEAAAAQEELPDDELIHFFKKEYWALLMRLRVSRAGMLEAAERGGGVQLLKYIEMNLSLE
jgi:hypothetical protein